MELKPTKYGWKSQLYRFYGEKILVCLHTVTDIHGYTLCTCTTQYAHPWYTSHKLMQYKEKLKYFVKEYNIY